MASTNSSYLPNIATHPGQTLRRMLESLDMSQVDLSERSGLTVKTINEIVQEKNPITPETAIKFAAIFGTTSTFWNNLQRNYEATLARLQEQELLKRESVNAKRFKCYSEIAELGFVPVTKNVLEKTRALLNFFGVSSLTYVTTTQAVAYRKTGQVAQSSEALAAWLRCGELRAREVEVAEFNREKALAAIEDFRALTKQPAESIGDALVKKCASFGVALVLMPHFKKTGVNAATSWLNADQALMQLTLRWSYSDIFWFNFFHELGHLLKHGKKEQFLEFGKGESMDEKEREADAFAQNALIPLEAYAAFLKKRIFSDTAIRDFAESVGISSSIVAGRLAREQKNYPRFKHLRSKFEFTK